MSDAAAGSVLGTGNPAPNPAAGGGEPAAGAAAGGDAGGWVGTLPEGVRGLALNKGWKGPEDALTSYANLEKLLGADKAGRGVVLPKDDAAPDEWAQFYGKLGRPETPDGYKIPVPEGDTGEFAKLAAGKFHELGLTAKQAEGLAQWWNEHGSGQMQQQEQAFVQQSAIDLQDLQGEWGPKFAENAELARRAIREAGLTPEEGAAVERALGVGKAAKAFAKLGEQFREAQMKGGEGRGSFAATPEEAKARIEALKHDLSWTGKLLSGDVGAREEWDRLHRIAFAAVE